MSSIIEVGYYTVEGRKKTEYKKETFDKDKINEVLRNYNIIEYIRICKEGRLLAYYTNGIFLTLKETLNIIEGNPKYKDIYDNIIDMYNKRTKKKKYVLYTPFNDTFSIIKNSKGINTLDKLIPGYKEVINVKDKINIKYKHHINTFNNNRFVISELDIHINNILRNKNQDNVYPFDFNQYNIDYNSAIEILSCYEEYNNVRDNSKYKNFRDQTLLYNYPSKVKAIHLFDLDLILKVNYLNEYKSLCNGDTNFYIILGINNNFTKEELNQAISLRISTIKALFGQNREAMQLIDQTLDMFNILRNENTKNVYDKAIMDINKDNNMKLM